MRHIMKNMGSRFFIMILVLGLAVPVWATVPGDIAAGVPLEKVIANGLATGMTVDAIISQALAAGAQYCPLLKAALAQGADLTRTFKAFMTTCAADSKLSEVCTPCSLMKCAVEAGRDMVEVADAIMAAGGKLEVVQSCLASLGYTGTYAYTPGAVPTVPSGIGPTFPGGGGGGGGPVSPSS